MFYFEAKKCILKTAYNQGTTFLTDTLLIKIIVKVWPKHPFVYSNGSKNQALSRSTPSSGAPSSSPAAGGDAGRACPGSWPGRSRMARMHIARGNGHSKKRVECFGEKNCGKYFCF